MPSSVPDEPQQKQELGFPKLGLKQRSQSSHGLGGVRALRIHLDLAAVGAHQCHDI